MLLRAYGIVTVAGGQETSSTFCTAIAQFFRSLVSNLGLPPAVCYFFLVCLATRSHYRYSLWRRSKNTKEKVRFMVIIQR